MINYAKIQTVKRYTYPRLTQVVLSYIVERMSVC